MAKEIEFYFFTAQRYDVPSDHINNRFVETIALELDRIRDQHWNAERANIFQTILLNFIFILPNDMMYRLVGTEIDLLGLFLWNLTEFGIPNGTRRGWSFFRQLFFSMSVGCLAREIYVTGLNYDFTCVTKLHTTS